MVLVVISSATMTQLKGIIRKMRTLLQEPVHYELPVGEGYVALNGLLGMNITMTHAGEIFCIACGKRTSKSYSQGFCFPCFQDSADCSPCIIRPDLCRAHEGFGRDMEWERKNHLVDQAVYVAWTGGLKVGVTRADNVHIRWVDQGATRAVVLAVTPNRHISGLVESSLKAHISDRTNWRRMLSDGDIEAADVLRAKHGLGTRLDAELQTYLSDDDFVTEITYPVLEFPEKVKSISFDKQPMITGTLQGIKGQYLMLDGGRVLNVRKHQGYSIAFEAS